MAATTSSQGLLSTFLPVDLGYSCQPYPIFDSYKGSKGEKRGKASQPKEIAEDLPLTRPEKRAKPKTLKKKTNVQIKKRNLYAAEL